MVDFIDYGVLPFVWIALGALLMLLAIRLISAGSRKFQFTKSNEKLLMLFQEHARLTNEKLIVEQQIAQCLQDEPVDRRVWYTTLQEQMHALPAFVVAQVKRFGLAEPPPDVPLTALEVQQVINEGAPSNVQVFADETGGVVVGAVDANVVELDGWTGRASGDR